MPPRGPLLFPAALLAGLLAFAPVASAQTPPADPVVARVNTTEIRLSDLSEAAQGLPAEMRAMPPAMLFPMLLDQLMDRAAIVELARKRGMDKDPAVARAMARAQDQALQNALMARDVGPLVTEAELRTRYDREIAGKPGEEEVHARHILLADEAAARAVIAELKGGADFAAIAKARSADKASGDGDLGFFKKTDMVPEFAAAAFSLPAGQITDAPVKSQFGFHIIRLDDKRDAPFPAFDEVKDQLKQRMEQTRLQQFQEDLRAKAKTDYK
ncbi:MAG: peptidylprolyl isomerase, partial [Devosia sp.]|nr:peptidylprolyl isomerase [Devosia sp.]